MAKWKFEGLDEYLRRLEKLQGDSKKQIGMAIYEGAGIVGREVAAEIQKLPVNNQHQSNGITSVQKKGLIEGFGISHIQDDNNYRNVKLGFDGYNGQKTKNHPNGQPNALIARAVNSGTSFRKKNPFVDRATRRAKGKCELAMREVIEKQINQIMGI